MLRFAAHTKPHASGRPLHLQCRCRGQIFLAPSDLLNRSASFALLRELHDLLLGFVIIHSRHRVTCPPCSPNGTAVLGVYYTTYQQYVSQLYQNVSKQTGQPAITMDDVVRNGSLYFADSIWKYYPGGLDPANNVMSHAPALGIYCYYRKRANESFGEIADCPEASAVLEAHAAELSSAGFSFIAPDATNWDGNPLNRSNGADLNQLRPTEIIAEEWANLRLKGTATPQLSTFDQARESRAGGEGSGASSDSYLNTIMSPSLRRSISEGRCTSGTSPNFSTTQLCSIWTSFYARPTLRACLARERSTSLPTSRRLTGPQYAQFSPTAALTTS
jgi:hypothetical protein